MQTVFSVYPITAKAKLWVKEHLLYEDWQEVNSDGVVVEHRCLGDIVAGMIEDGLQPDTDFRIY